MFGGRFSHTRFNLRDTAYQTVPVHVFFVENIKGALIFGENIPAQHDFRLRVDGGVIASRSVPFEADFSESLKSEASAKSRLLAAHDFALGIGAEIYLAADSTVRLSFAESAGADVLVGADTPAVSAFAETVDGEAYLAANVYTYPSLREAVFASVTSEILERDVFTINVALPPGSELRIDSQNYTVTLNGKSILSKHSGDWVMISRELVDLSVASGTTALTGSLLYTERYL